MAWSQARYRWQYGSGIWAAAHRRAAVLPGRAYPRASLVAADHGVRIAYFGFPEGKQHLLPFLRQHLGTLAGSATRIEGKPLRWRRLRDELAYPQADILLVGCSRRRAARLPRNRALVLPFRLQLLLDVPPDPDAVLKKVSGNERRQFLKLRRSYDWQWERGSGLSDFQFFYERMHLPTMSSRHGEDTRSMDAPMALRCLFQHGVLLFVTEGGKRVAGVLCRYQDGGAVLSMRMLGVLDGDETHYRTGAVKAAYYLTAEWAARNGIQRIDMSGCEPFPGKGIFQFKRRFHPTVMLPDNHFSDKRVWLRVGRDSAATRDFLAATPMVTIGADGDMEAVYFFDEDRPPRTRISATTPGIEKDRMINLDAFLGGLSGRASPSPTS
jgi:hypothetical protein